MLEITAKQNFWVARRDWGFSNEEGIHANVHLETPTQNYFLEMPEFQKWFFELWKDERLHSACEDENYDQSKGFSKPGFQSIYSKSIVPC